MKRVLGTIAICLIFAATAHAGIYKDLEPGVSTMEDVIRVLGKPAKEVVKKTRFVFDGEKHKVSLISIVANKDTKVIENIDVYPKKLFSSSNYVEWFKLNEPFEQANDQEGNLVEYYLPHGIALHFEGKEPTEKVVFVEHFDTRKYENFIKSDFMAPYLGIRLILHDGEGYKVLAIDADSPAEKSGMFPGDIVVEVGEKTFYQNRLDPGSFINVISALRIEEKAQFLVKRGEKTKKLSIKIVKPTGVQIKNNAENAFVQFKQGQILLNLGKMYDARDIFKTAIWMNPNEPLFYAALGNAYYQIGLKSFAIDELSRSVHMQPQVFPYYLLGIIHLEDDKIDDAIEAFKKVCALDAYDADVWTRLGLCYFKKERYKDALRATQKAYQINPESAGTLYRIGECYERLSQMKNALLFYQKAYDHENADNVLREKTGKKITFLQGVVPSS